MPTRSANAVTIAVALATAVWAQSPDPRDVLQKAQAAMGALHAVCYEAHNEAEGVLALQSPRFAATVTQVRVPDSDLPKLAIDAHVTMPQQGQSFRVQLVIDGKAATLVDHNKRMFLQRDLPAGAMFLNNFNAIMVRDLTSDRPLELESKAISLKYIGTGSVGTVECDVIQAVLAAEGGEVQWYFARSDHLPRRVQRFIETPMGRASLTTVVESLDTRPSIQDELFRVEKPEGYSDAPEPPGGSGSSGALLAAGKEAPDWTLKTADGQEVSLKSLRGKTVLLDFWATWCGPCKKAMPEVQKLFDQYKGKSVAVYGVNCWERDPRAKPADFIKNAGYTYPQLLNGNEVAQKYGVRGIPTFYVIGPDGKILWSGAGLAPQMMQQVTQMIDKTLLPANAPPTSQP